MDSMEEDEIPHKPEIPPNIDVSKGIFVDRGTFGHVYLCTAINRVPLAVKQIMFNKGKKREIEKKARAEYEALKKLSHTNIVQVYDFQERSDQFLIVMEFVSGGNLSDYIQESRNGFLSENEAIEFTKQLLNGAHYMISSGVVNRDIKPSNVLLDRSGSNFARPILKLADFGCGRVLPSVHANLSTQSGTCAYRAPETFRPGRDGNVSYGTRAEMWSIGLVMYEMLVGKRMFEGCNEQVIYQVGKLQQQTDLKYDLPHHVQAYVKEFLGKLLTVDKNSRPNAAEALDLINHLDEKKYDFLKTKYYRDLELDVGSHVEIIVKTVNGLALPIRMHPLHTVRHLKWKVQEKEGIPVNALRFVFSGVCIQEDERALSYYNIRNGSIVHQVLRLRGGAITVVVKSLVGKTMITLDSREVSTIVDIMAKIKAKKSIPPRRQHFVHIGRELRHLDLEHTIDGVSHRSNIILHMYTK